jgi:hypothetical protein
MWADNLLAAERAHLLRLFLWAAASILAGVALLALLSHKRTTAPLLRHFAMQAAAWGLIDLALGWYAWRELRLRDYHGAMALERILVLNVVLDVGYMGVGLALALVGALLATRRLGLVGAGLGVVTQGLALLVLDGVFLSQLGRLGIHG